MRSDDEQLNEIESLRERISELEAINRGLGLEVTAARSECAALRSELTCPDCHPTDRSVKCERHLHFAEPAMAPARPHCDDHAGWRSDCDRCAMYEQPAAPAHTEAEQAVLDAMAAMSHSGLLRGRLESWKCHGTDDLIAAELVRRVLKP